MGFGAIHFNSEKPKQYISTPKNTSNISQLRKTQAIYFNSEKHSQRALRYIYIFLNTGNEPHRSQYQTFAKESEPHTLKN